MRLHRDSGLSEREARLAVDSAVRERVWALADATLCSHSSDVETRDVADMAWGTLETLGWVSGSLKESPVTHRVWTQAPTGAEVAAELDACGERISAARSQREYAPLRGAADALRFVLGEPGPFWWTPLDDATRADASTGR
jgi:hypothetical protein